MEHPWPNAYAIPNEDEFRSYVGGRPNSPQFSYEVASGPIAISEPNPYAIPNENEFRSYVGGAIRRPNSPRLSYVIDRDGRVFPQNPSPPRAPMPPMPWPPMPMHGMQWFSMPESIVFSPFIFSERVARNRALGVGQSGQYTGGGVLPGLGSVIIGKKYKYSDLINVWERARDVEDMREVLVFDFVRIRPAQDFTVIKIHRMYPPGGEYTGRLRINGRTVKLIDSRRSREYFARLQNDARVDNNLELLWPSLNITINNEKFYDGVSDQHIILELYDVTSRNDSSVPDSPTDGRGPHFFVRLSDFMYFLSQKHNDLHTAAEKAIGERINLKDLSLKPMQLDPNLKGKILGYLKQSRTATKKKSKKQKRHRTKKSNRKTKRKTRRRP
tara:strand:+ start:808 stop:1962 length:1155 start_codon:yes stop_codon:yes gene_type:complete